MDEDDALMIRAKGGDASAFDAVVRRHQHRLQRFAARMADGDAARGADVAVGALLRLWESRHAYRPEGRCGAWLLRTAYRILVDEARRERPTEALDESLRVVADPPERTALARAVRDAVSRLAPTHRAVVVLTVYEGLSHEEAADALGIPPGTVASRKHQALKTLRRRLAAWEDPR